MAMFYYNPNQGKRNLDSKDSNWTAEIGEGSLKGRLVVIEKETKYVVDGFENKTGYEFEKEDIWYSLDYENGNFHIVPGTLEGEIPLGTKLGCIRRNAANEEIPGITVEEKVKHGSGKDGCTTNHKWICAKTEKHEYLMSFNRLWCDVKDDGTHICNNFGQAQFMCYPKTDGQINLFPNGFKMMYPRSGDDGEGRFDCKSGHLAYNPPYDINDCAEMIAKGFVEFIELCEIMKNEKTT